MKFNHKVFFDNVKKYVDPTLTQSQVNGLEFLLSSFEQYAKFWTSIRQIAYAFATVAHETASSFQPVEEGYYLGGQKAINFQNGLRYAPFFGRGYVQLTWDYNYETATKELRKQMPELVAAFEKRTNQKFDLKRNPAQAKDRLIAFATMTLGMKQGWFRPGHTLDKYINAKKTDYVWARYIINGKKRGATYPDRALDIAELAKKFEAILRIASMATALAAIPASTDEPEPSITVTPDQPEPDQSLSVDLPAIDQSPPTTTTTTQQADAIVNVGTDAAAVPDNFVPEDKPLTAPAKDGATDASVKMTIGGIAVPGFIVVVIKVIQDLIEKGFVSAAEVGSTLLTFIGQNLKWIFILIGLIIVLLIVKKLVKQITFWIQMWLVADPKRHNPVIIPDKTEPETVNLTLWQRLKVLATGRI